jgi:hypothetical protein
LYRYFLPDRIRELRERPSRIRMTMPDRPHPYETFGTFVGLDPGLRNPLSAVGMGHISSRGHRRAHSTFRNAISQKNSPILGFHWWTKGNVSLDGTRHVGLVSDKLMDGPD